MVPLALTLGIFTGTWWYVVIYNAPAAAAVAKSQTAPEVRSPAQSAPAPVEKPQELGSSTDKPQELTSVEEQATELGQAETTAESDRTVHSGGRSAARNGHSCRAAGRREPRARCRNIFTPGFGVWRLFSALLLVLYYRRMDGEQFEILKELAISVVPLGVLTIVVLAVIFLGICTATESAAVGALGALYLAVLVKYPRSLRLVESGRGRYRRGPRHSRAATSPRSSFRVRSARFFVGTVVPLAQ